MGWTRAWLAQLGEVVPIARLPNRTSEVPQWNDDAWVAAAKARLRPHKLQTGTTVVDRARLRNLHDSVRVTAPRPIEPGYLRLEMITDALDSPRRDDVNGRLAVDFQGFRLSPSRFRAVAQTTSVAPVTPIAEPHRRCQKFYAEWYPKQAQDEYDGVKEVSEPPALAERRWRLGSG